MTGLSDTVSIPFLEEYGDAWNRHDIDTIMNNMTEDCVFELGGGPEICGRRYEGADRARKKFISIFEGMPDAHWGNSIHFISGDRGVSEWIFSGTNPDGSKMEVNGCDIFTFRDGKISLKNSYLKNRVKPRS